MGYKTIVLLIVFAGSLVSCGKSTHCEGFDPAYRSWIPYSYDDTVRFKNDNNDRLFFVINEQTIDIPYDAKRGDNCITPGALINGNSASSRNGRNILNIVVAKYGTYKIVYQVFDFSTTFKIDLTTMTPDDNSPAQILDSVTLGGTTYMNVYSEQRDTLASGPAVWKTYYNRQFGILGFYDRQTHSLFYRE